MTADNTLLSCYYSGISVWLLQTSRQYNAGIEHVKHFILYIYIFENILV